MTDTTTKEEQLKQLTTNPTSLVGILRIKAHIHGSNKGKYRYIFQPYQYGIPPLLVYTNINRTSTPGEVLALVKFTHWKDGELHPSGQMVRKFGSTLNKDDIMTSWIYHYQLESILKSVRTRDLVIKREGLVLDTSDISAPIYSIDPLGCVDVDDAFQYEPTKDDNGAIIGHRLAIHITCMGDQFDILSPHLLGRAFSLYLPDKTHHLLPTQLVEQFSLLAGQKRLSLALICKFDIEGKLTNQQFKISEIINSRQLTYQQVDSYIGSRVTCWMELQAFITLLRQTNPIFVAKEDKKIDSHLIVETMMILYNCLGTKYLLEQHLKPILRVHPPIIESTMLPKDLDTPLQEFLKFLDYQSANYSIFDSSQKEEKRAHFGLGITNYGHLTSPMRRIVDTYNQALIIGTLTNTKIESVVDIDSINTIETQQRKFYRRCQIYGVAEKIQDKTIRTELFVFDDLGEGFYRIYWPKHKITSKIKIGINDPKPKLYTKIAADVAIIHNPLPRLRVNLRIVDS